MQKSNDTGPLSINQVDTWDGLKASQFKDLPLPLLESRRPAKPLAPATHQRLPAMKLLFIYFDGVFNKASSYFTLKKILDFIVLTRLCCIFFRQDKKYTIVDVYKHMETEF